MRPRLRFPIALVGLSGAGKSVVARILARRLGVGVADLDGMVEEEQGATVAELFERRGEAFFRDCEARALDRALVVEPQVIACGGGVVLDSRNRETLRRRCQTVWLEVEPDAAAARIALQLAVRPLLGAGPPGPRLATLLAERAGLYAEVARARVVTTGLDLEQVADAVVDALDVAAR